MTVWLEPWGEDYTLLPKEECVVVASGEKPWFNLVFTDNNNVKVYAEDTSEAKVMRGSEVLRCGHQRGRT